MLGQKGLAGAVPASGCGFSIWGDRALRLEIRWAPRAILVGASCPQIIRQGIKSCHMPGIVSTMGVVPAPGKGD